MFSLQFFMFFMFFIFSYPSLSRGLAKLSPIRLRLSSAYLPPGSGSAQPDPV